MLGQKISLSTHFLQDKFGEKEAIRIAAEVGAEAIDFSLMDRKKYNCREPDSIYARSDDEIFAHFRELGDYARSLGLEVGQTHGKSSGFKNIPEEDDVMVENIRRDLLVTKAFGAPVCVVHTTTCIYMGADPDPALMHRLNFEQFTRTLPFAKEYGVILATETFGDAVRHNCCDFFGISDEFLKGYNRVCAVGDNADWFKICVDTGHSNKAHRYGQPTPGDVIRLCGPNIVALHLNDNDGFVDQHKLPMTGTIDWDDVFAALSEVGYKGNYNMELHLYEFGWNFLPETSEFAVKLMKNILREKGIRS